MNLISQAANGGRTAFAVLEGETHGSIIMKRAKTLTHNRARELFKRAVSLRPDEWDGWCDELDELQRGVESRTSWRKDPGKHLYQNVVLRVRDDAGNPGPDYFMEFYENDADTSWLGNIFHREVIRAVHRHSDNSEYRNMYLDISALHHRIDQRGVDHLDIGIHAEPQFAEDAAVGYGAASGKATLSPDAVRKYFRPNQTLLVDLKIKREMRSVFTLHPAVA